MILACQQAKQNCSILYHDAEILNVVMLSVECRVPQRTMLQLAVLACFSYYTKSSTDYLGCTPTC